MEKYMKTLSRRKSREITQLKSSFTNVWFWFGLCKLKRYLGKIIKLKMKCICNYIWSYFHEKNREIEFALHSTEWKFKNFPVTQIFMWNKILPFQNLENGQFGHLHFEPFLTLSNWCFNRNQNSKPPKYVKWQFLIFWNQPDWFHVKS